MLYSCCTHVLNESTWPSRSSNADQVVLLVQVLLRPASSDLYTMVQAAGQQDGEDAAVEVVRLPRRLAPKGAVPPTRKVEGLSTERLGDYLQHCPHACHKLRPQRLQRVNEEDLLGRKVDDSGGPVLLASKWEDPRSPLQQAIALQPLRNTCNVVNSCRLVSVVHALKSVSGVVFFNPSSA